MSDDNGQPLRVPPGDLIASRVMGPCPFSTDDPRYEGWRRMGRLLGEIDMRNRADLLHRAAGASFEEQRRLYLEALVQRFDLIGHAFVATVSSYEDADRGEQLMAAATELNLQQIRSLTGRNASWGGPDQYARLKMLLAQRSAHWIAAALTAARNAESEQVPASPPHNVEHSAQTPRSVPPVEGRDETNSARDVTGAVIARRKVIVQRFRDERELTAVKFARLVGASDTAIRAIIREDTSRFAAPKRDRLLETLGIALDDWYRE